MDEITVNVSRVEIFGIWFGLRSKVVDYLAYLPAVLEEMVKRRNRCYVPGIPTILSPALLTSSPLHSQPVAEVRSSAVSSQFSTSMLL